MKSECKSTIAASSIIWIISIVAISNGAILHVPGDYPTIQEAYIASVTGDTICVTDQGIYAQNLNFSETKDVNLISDPAGATIQFRKGTWGSYTNNSTYTLRIGKGNIKIKNFVIDGYDASNSTYAATHNIYIASPSSDLDVNLVDCTVNRYNIGSYISAGSYICNFNLNNCIYTDGNPIQQYAREIVVVSNSNPPTKVKAKRCTFNHVQQWGGMMFWMKRGIFDLQNCLLMGNFYRAYAINIDMSSASSDECSVILNHSTLWTKGLSNSLIRITGLTSPNPTPINITLKNSILGGKPAYAINNTTGANATINYIEENCLITGRYGLHLNVDSSSAVNRLSMVGETSYHYPMLLDPDAGDFRPTYRSPVVNSANPASGIIDDRTGTLRDSLPDRGCSESNPSLGYAYPGHSLMAKFVPSNMIVNGFPSSWNAIKTTTLHQTMEGGAAAAGKDRAHDIDFAWDYDNLYILIAETVQDNQRIEGSTSAEWLLNPYKYDGVGFFDIADDGSFNNNADDGQPKVNIGLWVGMSSDGNPRVAHGNVRHTFVGGKRTSEAAVPWSWIAPDATIEPGYQFSFDPVIVDSDSDNWYSGSFINDWITGYIPSQSFMGGGLRCVEGKTNYTILHLGYWSDLSKDNIVNFKDFAIFAEDWLFENCSPANSNCNGADIAPLSYGDGYVDIDDLSKFVGEWLNN